MNESGSDDELNEHLHIFKNQKSYDLNDTAYQRTILKKYTGGRVFGF